VTLVTIVHVIKKNAIPSLDTARVAMKVSLEFSIALAESRNWTTKTDFVKLYSASSFLYAFAQIAVKLSIGFFFRRVCQKPFASGPSLEHHLANSDRHT
jgi:hypothetical protein